MMETRFTPGPWAIEQPNEDTPFIWIVAKTSSGVAKIETCDYDDGRGERLTEEDRANAHLIAAAPDLFVHAAAAERGITEAVRILDLMGRGQAARDLAIYANNLRAALHKALGETQ
jgi:hypothetical protein